MTLRIAQDFQYVGNDYWKWRAWIEGDELGEVEQVVWILHPSFAKPRITVKTRDNGFRLDASGWGTFLLRAELSLQGGRTQALRHNLRLEYPDEEAAPMRSASAPRPRAASVFLSYSSIDARAAARLRDGLTQAGVQVLDQTGVTPGEPWQEALANMIARADAVVTLVGDDDMSPWVSAEMSHALASDKPTLALFNERAATPRLPEGVQTRPFNPREPDAQGVREWLGQVVSR
ncbi:TIR domain-containing protein [Ideonella sp. 4Y11]|uniref:TIR domain-containing protein n=1 Tax=Ideonella aquatica TaxID=2824119 RepID=A0A940YPN3_9BURK|nr:pYEATS domain-containing protein [Ideonella aquatica]MBQ0961729.1 TIR domain-containing protein [Ideonella aquatica]